MESNLLELSGAVCSDTASPSHCTTVTWECSLTVTSQQTPKKTKNLQFSVGPLLLQDFPTSNQTGAAATIVRLQGSCGASLSAQVRNPVLRTSQTFVDRRILNYLAILMSWGRNGFFCSISVYYDQ